MMLAVINTSMLLLRRCRGPPPPSPPPPPRVPPLQPASPCARSPAAEFSPRRPPQPRERSDAALVAAVRCLGMFLPFQVVVAGTVGERWQEKQRGLAVCQLTTGQQCPLEPRAQVN